MIASSPFPERDGVDCVRVRLETSRDGSPQPFKASLGAPLAGAVGAWRTDLGFAKGLVQTWKGEARMSSSLATDAPVAAFYGTDSGNRLTVACSESVRKVVVTSGIDEERRGLGFSAEFFTEPEASLRSYEVELRVDRRAVFYADAVRDAFDWCVGRLGGEADGGVPSGAFEPLYSTWYSYKQGVSAASVERECEAAAAPAKCFFILSLPFGSRAPWTRRPHDVISADIPWCASVV